MGSRRSDGPEPVDEASRLETRARQGRLAPCRLELAAALGHPPAIAARDRLAEGDLPAPPTDVRALVRAALVGNRWMLDRVYARRRDARTFPAQDAALAAARACLDDPTPEGARDLLEHGGALLAAADEAEAEVGEGYVAFGVWATCQAVASLHGAEVRPPAPVGDLDRVLPILDRASGHALCGLAWLEGFCLAPELRDGIREPLVAWALDEASPPPLPATWETRLGAEAAAGWRSFLRSEASWLDEDEASRDILLAALAEASAGAAPDPTAAWAERLDAVRAELEPLGMEDVCDAVRDVLRSRSARSLWGAGRGAVTGYADALVGAGAAGSLRALWALGLRSRPLRPGPGPA